MDFISAIRITIRKHSMIRRGERVLAAVSGGQDSMALMHALYRLRKSMGFELGVAHVDHNIRRKSHLDLEFVKSRALELGLPFYSDTLHVKKVSASRGTGLEETARELRYGALGTIAEKEGFDRIATGHTASDQAETVLMRILSGTGIRGLGGIIPVRDDGVIRPMLNVTRGEVEAFVAKEGIPFVTDETNADTKITRNRIRHILMPLIRDEINPRSEISLAGLAESARELSLLLETTAAKRMKSLLEGLSGETVVLRRKGFNALDAALKGPVIENALDMVATGSRLDRDHIDKLVEIAGNFGGSTTLSLPGRITASFSYETITLSPAGPSAHLSEPVARAVGIPGPGTYEIPWAGIKLRFGGKMPGGRKGASWDRVSAGYPFTVRPFKPGDRITRPFSKHTKKLKKLFIDLKVPRDKRGCIPIVCSGDTVVWVPGLTTPPTPLNQRRAIHVSLII